MQDEIESTDPGAAESCATRAPVPDWFQDFAHELRTPLGGILAIADILAQNAATSRDKQLVEALRASSEHLRHLASSVIDAHYDGTAIHRYETRSIDQADWLAPLLASFEARATAQGLAFASSVSAEVPLTIHADPLRLRQMLENIIDNAIKVSKRGVISLDIRPGKDGLLRFGVRDQGPGFLRGDLARLFQRRMQSLGGPKGTGIGLSLVRRYAEMAGGRAGADNHPEGGAEVWFEVPCWPVTGQGGRPRALVVEDSHAGRLLLKTMLEHLGFSVETAVGGSAAQDALRSGAFALVTVDRMLGDTDGVDLATRLRSWLGSSSATRIIAITGRIDEADRAAFAIAGADGFLPKPVAPRALAELINRFFAGRSMPDAAAA